MRGENFIVGLIIFLASFIIGYGAGRHERKAQSIYIPTSESSSTVAIRVLEPVKFFEIKVGEGTYTIPIRDSDWNIVAVKQCREEDEDTAGECK